MALFTGNKLDTTPVFRQDEVSPVVSQVLGASPDGVSRSVKPSLHDADMAEARLKVTNNNNEKQIS